MPFIPLLPERGFPSKTKQVANLLNLRTRKLEEMTADEPLRLEVSEANIKLSASEELLRLLSVISQLDESGIIEDLLNGEAGIGNSSVSAQYWDSATSTVVTAQFVIIAPP